MENGRTIGGMARIGHLIKQAKAKSDRVLAVDAGDIFQGTPFFEEYHGQSDVECLNKAGYDVYTIGNHEFDNGPQNLAEALKSAKFDVISANLDTSGSPALAPLVKASVVKTIAGEKVGFVGAITPKLNEVAPKLQGVKLKATGANWFAPIQSEINLLKSQGINKIVVVSHCGVELEKELAESIPDIDVIIGGHSHTRLEQPLIVKHDDGSVCAIGQTGCYGRALGRFDLVFDEKGHLKLTDTHYRLINITDRIFEDPDLKAYIMEKEKPFAKLKTTIVGYAEARFDNRFRNYPWDSPIGDLICDALYDAGKSYGGTIALQNRGGIRAGIDQGPISAERIREVLPFNNQVVIATISGATLMATLENSVSGILGARFLDVCGLKLAYDPNKEAGKRLIFVYTIDKDGGWKPLKLDQSYRIVINDFSFNGGEGYDFKTAKNVVITDKKLSVIFQEYLERVKRVRPHSPSRLVAVNGELVKEQSSDSDRRFTISYPAPGAEISIITGSAEGVELLPKIGTVPISAPHLAKSGLRLNENGQYAIRASEILGSVSTNDRLKKETPLWFAVSLMVHNANGSTTRIVSAPVKLR